MYTRLSLRLFKLSYNLQDRGSLFLSVSLNGLEVKFYMAVGVHFLCTVEFYSLFPVELCISVSVSLLLSCLSVCLSLIIVFYTEQGYAFSVCTCNGILATRPR